MTPGTRRLLPLLTAGLFGACLVACWGLTSLALDEDVIRLPEAGPLLGPAMALGATLTVLLWSARVLRSARPGGPAVLAGVSVWAAMLLVGAVGALLVRASGAAFLLFAGEQAASPFLLLPALLAALTVFALGVLGGPPRTFDRHGGPDYH